MLVEAKSVTLADLRQDSYEGFSNTIYRFTIEVPLDFLQRYEPGPLMAFNVTHKDLYEVMLGAKRAYTNSIVNGTANITIEIGDAYLPLALRDLKKVNGAYVLIPDSNE